jgi:hypothetical protein
MTDRRKVMRRIVLIAISSVYLIYAFRIGFWITGDIHSGGPIVGVILFPLFVSLVTIALYWPERKTRSLCAMIIGAYLVVGTILFLTLR